MASNSKKAWYNSTWFYIVVVALMVAIFGVVLYRKNRDKKSNSEQEGTKKATESTQLSYSATSPMYEGKAVGEIQKDLKKLHEKNLITADVGDVDDKYGPKTMAAHDEALGKYSISDRSQKALREAATKAGDLS